MACASILGSYSLLRQMAQVSVQMSHDQKVTAFLRGGGAARGQKELGALRSSSRRGAHAPLLDDEALGLAAALALLLDLHRRVGHRRRVRANLLEDRSREPARVGLTRSMSAAAAAELILPANSADVGHTHAVERGQARPR